MVQVIRAEGSELQVAPLGSQMVTSGSCTGAYSSVVNLPTDTVKVKNYHTWGAQVNGNTGSEVT